MRFPRMTMRRLLVAVVLALIVQRIALGLGSLPVLFGSPTDDPASVKEGPRTSSLAPIVTPARPHAGQGSRSIRRGVLVQGRVVDDQTGDPVEYFALERGHVEGQDPEKANWGK